MWSASIYSYKEHPGPLYTVRVGKTGMETLKNIPNKYQEFKPYSLGVPAAKLQENIETLLTARASVQKGNIVNHLFFTWEDVAYAAAYSGSSAEMKLKAAAGDSC